MYRQIIICNFWNFIGKDFLKVISSVYSKLLSYNDFNIDTFDIYIYIYIVI